jgi:hypothetical protein
LVAGKIEPAKFDQSFADGSLLTRESTRHFEKAQMLLRSVRNASPGGAPDNQAQVDLTYERELSRRLLYHNILLRREAESRGDLPASAVLGDLEPFLLDIANLPDHPVADDLNGIKERLRRKEMIAALQVYAVQPALTADRNE